MIKEKNLGSQQPSAGDFICADEIFGELSNKLFVNPNSPCIWPNLQGFLRDEKMHMPDIKAIFLPSFMPPAPKIGIVMFFNGNI